MLKQPERLAIPSPSGNLPFSLHAGQLYYVKMVSTHCAYLLSRIIFAELTPWNAFYSCVRCKANIATGEESMVCLFVWIYKFWHITALPQFHLLSQITLHKPQSHWRQLSACVQICSHSHRCNRAQFQNRLFHPARPSHVWIFNSCCSQDVFYR